MPDPSALQVEVSWVTAFLLMLARTGGWILVTPLFGARGVAPIGKLALSIALAIPLATVASTQNLPTSVAAFAVEAIVQFLLGMGFGFLTGILLYAPAVAGSIADVMSGLGYAVAVDPASGASSGIFSRLFGMTFMTLLLVTGAYLTIISGFARSVQAFGIGTRLEFGPDTLMALSQSVTDLLRAAFEVGAPMLGILLLTDVALGLAARFFPQAGITFLGLGLKILIATAAAGAVLALLPAHIDGLVEAGERLVSEVLQTVPGGG